MRKGSVKFPEFANVLGPGLLRAYADGGDVTMRNQCHIGAGHSFELMRRGLLRFRSLSSANPRVDRIPVAYRVELNELDMFVLGAIGRSSQMNFQGIQNPVNDSLTRRGYMTTPGLLSPIGHDMQPIAAAFVSELPKMRVGHETSADDTTRLLGHLVANGYESVPSDIAKHIYNVDYRPKWYKGAVDNWRTVQTELNNFIGMQVSPASQYAASRFGIGLPPNPGNG